MLEDVKIPTRLEPSASWTALMFCYVYSEYFGPYPPGSSWGCSRVRVHSGQLHNRRWYPSIFD